MLKVLITGSSAFIGKNLLQRLCMDYNVYAPKREELDLFNAKDVENYLRNNKFDVVIHSANQNSTRNTTVSSYDVLDGNLRMFLNLERCKSYYGKMYYFGSGAEYDASNYISMMKEEYFGSFIPVDTYGFSKYTMSKIAEQNNNIYDLRLFGVFGKYEEWERRFISNAICKCIYNLPITIRQNVYFDYIYIDDLVEIMKWFIEHTPQMKHYNVCTGKRIDLLTLANKVRKILDKQVNIEVNLPGLKLEYTGNNDRLITEIGNIKFTNVDTAIENLCKYYISNKEIINIEKLKIIY